MRPHPPLQPGGVAIQSVREVGVHAALCEHGQEIIPDVNGGDSIQTVLIQNRGQAHIAQRGVVIADARRVSPIDGEAARPKCRLFDRPVLCDVAILHSGQVDDSIALVPIADDGGNGVLIVSPTVTATDFVFVINLVINFYIELPGRCVRQQDRSEVGIGESGIRNIRMRVKIEDRLTDRINIGFACDRTGGVWNYVARKLSVGTCRICVDSAGAGIEDAVSVRGTLREIASTLQIRGHHTLNVDGIALPNFLKINKEESTILDDWPAHCETVLIADVIRLIAGIEIVPGVEVGALSVPPSTSVELVGAL